MRQHVSAAINNLADRSPALRQAAATAIGKLAKQAGANSTIVDDAVAESRHRPLSETRAAIQWARAVARSGRMPRGFRPDRALADPAARSTALNALGGLLERKSSIQMERQRLYLDEEASLEEAGAFVEATLSRRLVERTSGKYDKTIKVRQAFAVMSALIDRLEQEGHQPFLVSGTLLGVVREGDLLKQDYDVDLGLLPGDGTIDGIAAIVEQVPGFRAVREEHRVLAEHDSGVGIDLFLHYERDGRLWHATDIHEWWNTPFELTQLGIRGRDFWVPSDSERYLEENYGNWQSPIAFYHMSFDTPNRVYRQNKHGVLYLYNIMTNAIEDGDRFVAESAARELRDSFSIDLTGFMSDGPLLEKRA